MPARSARRLVVAAVARLGTWPSLVAETIRQFVRAPGFIVAIARLWICSMPRSRSERPVAELRHQVRRAVRTLAGLPEAAHESDSVDALVREIRTLSRWAWLVRIILGRTRSNCVIFVGQAYYNHWYLSRELLKVGWRARLVDWDLGVSGLIHYHGWDRDFRGSEARRDRDLIAEYVASLYEFDFAHFANAEGLQFASVSNEFNHRFDTGFDIRLMRRLGLRILHTNSGCRDGVLRSRFAEWGPESPCSTCRWRSEPSVCSDPKNRAWGMFRNSLVDVHFLLGGNRADFNDDNRCIEAPEIYCLDPEVWHPDLQIPERLRLAAVPAGTVRLYHAVGNMRERTDADGVNIKSSHIYLPLVESMRARGLPVQLVSPPPMSNQDIRFIQAQSDIFLEMLSYGWFGATAREFMMLGKPVIGFIRPEWLESVREQCPEYARDLPIVRVTIDTVEEVLQRLVNDDDLRSSIGKRSRAFAMKWHSAAAGAGFVAEIYSALREGRPLPRGPREGRRVSHV